MSSTKPSPVRTATNFGRLVRSGAVAGAPRDQFGNRLRALAQAVSNKLEVIRADSEFTPKERRAAVESVLKQARAEADKLQREAADTLSRVDGCVHQIKERVGRHELAMSPLSVERVKRLSDRLAQLDDIERSKAFDRAVEQRDSDTLLALQLADPLDHRAQVGMAVLHDPEGFQRLTEIGGNTLAGIVAAQNLIAGLDDLAQCTDPADLVNGADASDLIQLGNAPMSVAAVPPDRISATWRWPGWTQEMVRNHAVAAASAPPPAPTETAPADREGFIQ